MNETEAEDTMLRWVAGTLIEPLTSLDQRTRAEHALFDLARESPDWLIAWMAGVMTEIGGSLPAGDRWRRLSGRIGGLTVGDNPPPDDGATLDGQTFGTWEDGTDICQQVMPRVGIDPRLVPLEDPLRPLEAAVVAFAVRVGSWRDMVTALETLWEQLDSDRGSTMGRAADEQAEQILSDIYPETAETWVEHATSAMRWLVWRRRAYVAPGDMFALDSALAWSGVASSIQAGRPVDDTSISERITTARTVIENREPLDYD